MSDEPRDEDEEPGADVGSAQQIPDATMNVDALVDEMYQEGWADGSAPHVSAPPPLPPKRVLTPKMIAVLAAVVVVAVVLAVLAGRALTSDDGQAEQAAQQEPARAMPAQPSTPPAESAGEAEDEGTVVLDPVVFGEGDGTD